MILDAMRDGHSLFTTGGIERLWEGTRRGKRSSARRRSMVGPAFVDRMDELADAHLTAMWVASPRCRWQLAPADLRRIDHSLLAEVQHESAACMGGHGTDP
jgi:hypothetical protein